ncbi:MAG: molybdopterin molybdotransferase, partial [Rhizobiales bacterium]|nr:molybdopterin molybdotransferase [Hyphomicrobiales bacterium]
MDQRILACCDSVSSGTVDVDSVAGLIARAVHSIGETQTVPLRKAAGRVLRGDILSGMPLPPFDHSAVDGYGFRTLDLNDAATS